MGTDGRPHTQIVAANAHVNVTKACSITHSMELALKTFLIHTGHFHSEISNSLKVSGHSNFELFFAVRYFRENTVSITKFIRECKQTNKQKQKQLVATNPKYTSIIILNSYMFIYCCTGPYATFSFSSMF